MALTDPFFTQAGLCEIQLPDRTIRLCDGGFIDWAARGLFSAEDEVFGTIESVAPPTEAVSDEAPSWGMTLLPPDIVAAADLFQPDAQGAPAYFWLAELDGSTGALLTEPDLMMSGFVDTLTLTASKQRRSVEITFVSEAERFFWTSEGHVLSPRFHYSIFPGEKGLDHTTGVQLAVPWGTSGPGRGEGLFGYLAYLLAAAHRQRTGGT